MCITRGGGGGVHARESRREKPEGGYECNVSYQLEGEEGGERGDRQE